MPMENLRFDFRCDFCKKLYSFRMKGTVNDVSDTMGGLISSLVNDGWETRLVRGETVDKHICPNCVKGENNEAGRD